jgi:exodeoxyribonuclease V gamma subunit
MNTKSESVFPGFMVLHGNRLEDLRDLLVQILGRYKLPVFSSENILVQNNGMKHWLEMSLANEDTIGICAATKIEFPSTFLWGIYRTVLSDLDIPIRMPFDKKSLTWRLYKLLPDLVSQAKFHPLKKYLGEVHDSRRLYQLVSQIADVFDGYQNYRADWLIDWSNGNDRLKSDSYLANPSNPIPLGDDEVWQSELWRALREDIGPELEDASRASVHSQFILKMDKLIDEFNRTKKKPIGLPERIIIFGISSLPPQVIEAFAKIGSLCQVFMFVQNPCQYYWGDIVDGHEILKVMSRKRQNRQFEINHEDLHLTSQPLLSSWGKQGRDYFHLLDGFDNVSTYKDKLQKVDVFNDPLGTGIEATQLRQIQSSILNLASPSDLKVKLNKSENDESIQFASSHSTQREVEILHDQLHSWLDNDQDLRAEEIMVMVPDMETFLPHIRAVFGRFTRGDSRYIPFSIADTTPKETPIVRALTQLLSTPTLKITIIDWLNLFEVDAVCKKFDLTSADLEQLRGWIEGSGIRWGLDKEHRVQHGMDSGLADLNQNSWDFGLQRLLLGYSLEANKCWNETLAYPGVGGLDGPTVSKLIDWIDSTKKINAELSIAKTPNQWVKFFKESILDGFFKHCDDAQERLLEKVFEPLEEWLAICDQCSFIQEIDLQVVRDYWLQQLEEVGLQQRFFGGGVQFGTLMPMRSIPFKIICLLGMNDGDFPRQTSIKDFDLMNRNWRTGDRSRREDDRYLFLEALLCARQKLYVSWQGNSARDNSKQPESVLVAQLIDYINSNWNQKVVPVKYPLQPFSKEYFDSNSKLITYDKDWEQTLGHHLMVKKTDVNGKNDHVTTIQESPTFGKLLQVDLTRLLRYPIEIYFRKKLNINIDYLEEETAETEPFTLNHLEEYKVSDSFLRSKKFDEVDQNLRLTGQLPLQGFGEILISKTKQKVLKVIQSREELAKAYPQLCDPIPISIKSGETVLEGVLVGLMARSNSNELEYLQIGQRVGAVTEKIKNFKFPRGHIIINLWINHLLACASGLKLTSVQIGSDAQIILNPLSIQKSLDILAKLVDHYEMAWSSPLPVACKTAWIWLQTQLYNQSLIDPNNKDESEDLDEAASSVFESSFHKKGELEESVYLKRAFNGYDDLREKISELSNSLYGDLACASVVNMFSDEETP